jgi:predicted DNA-binding transcriptional regulator AlpA
MNNIKLSTVKLIRRLLQTFVDVDVITVSEMNFVVSNLRHIAEKGELKPIVIPKLISQSNVSDYLGISLANFKKLEREGAFSFKRKMLGSSVRYRNTEVIEFILSKETE